MNLSDNESVKKFVVNKKQILKKTNIDNNVIINNENLKNYSYNSNVVIASHKLNTYQWFPSYRMTTAIMLCLCFASIHIMNSNMSMAMVCMIDDKKLTNSIILNQNISKNNVNNIITTKNLNKKLNNTKSKNILKFNTSTLTTSNKTFNSKKHKKNISFTNFSRNKTTKFFSQKKTLKHLLIDYLTKPALKVQWSSEEQGWIFSAFNAGLLCMLFTGFLADKLNAKYMIIISVFLSSFANFLIPVTANYNVRYVIMARFLIGLSEALLQPAINSLVTRWFPSFERSYALGLATGGRQIGTLLIMPTAGALCAQKDFFGGWPSIFYASGSTGLIFVVFYSFLGADKPSKQSCISNEELKFITTANICEDMGKKRMERKVPWKKILTSAPVWSALISVVCHEFPLMTMIMFLPSYLHDVHHYETTKNGILSAIPTIFLWISKLASSYLNTWFLEKTNWKISTISKILNGVGSIGLAVFMIGTTFLDSSQASIAVIFLCLSMFFTGMHTPGCQAALVAIAPAFSGAITGLTFFFVAILGIINPTMTKWIVTTGSQIEWNIVFYISTVIALIPVIVFSACGSADVQEWAVAPTKTAKIPITLSCPTLGAIVENISTEKNSEKKT